GACGGGAAGTWARRLRPRPQPPRTSVARLADYLAGGRIQAQLDVLALCVLGFGLPDAVLEFDVMDLGVACGREPGLDVGLAQVGDLLVGIDLAALRIDRQVDAVAVGAARVRAPDAVLELD